jgi:hypothetical protein
LKENKNRFWAVVLFSTRSFLKRAFSYMKLTGFRMDRQFREKMADFWEPFIFGVWFLCFWGVGFWQSLKKYVQIQHLAKRLRIMAIMLNHASYVYMHQNLIRGD